MSALAKDVGDVAVEVEQYIENVRRDHAKLVQLKAFLREIAD
ncbi:MAG: hypothetical protein QJR02_01425 [Sinobacteraceae bacterium]|nr:hypothetical protein [Nevskiaceae bacterium]